MSNRFLQIDQKKLKDLALSQSKDLQKRRSADLNAIAYVEKFLKDNEKDQSEVMVRLRTAREALNSAVAVIAPTAASSKIADYAAAQALSKTIDKAPRLTVKVQTQEVQVSKSNIWTGQHLERSGSAQVFYRLSSSDGALMQAGYLEYSTPQTGIDVAAEEWFNLAIPSSSTVTTGVK